MSKSGQIAPFEDRENSTKNSSPFIETHNLSVYYKEKPALKDVTLPVISGAITAVVGPSGCGKSSFLLSLNRLTDLIEGCHVSGSVKIGNLEVLNEKTDLTSLRRRVGLIFQKPNPFPLSVSKNITLPLREHGLKDKNEIRSVVEKVLTDVGLWDEVKDRMDAPAVSLSGGQQQRLCIARALALEPKALLLDEPCSALDPLSSGVVEDLILSLKDHYTILVVTHNLAQARRIADFAALFWVQNGAGRLIEYGTTRQIFEAPEQRLTEAYVNGMRG